MQNIIIVYMAKLESALEDERVQVGEEKHRGDSAVLLLEDANTRIDPLSVALEEDQTNAREVGALFHGSQAKASELELALEKAIPATPYW